MNKFNKTVLILTAATLGAASPIYAQDEALHEIGLSATPFGLGLFYGYQLNDEWSFKTEISGFDSDETEFGFSDIDYEGDGEASAISLGMEWSPFSEGWARKVYFSGGLLSSEAEFDGDAKTIIGDSIEIGDASIAASSIDGLNLSIDYDRKISPYLGVGWSSKAVGEAGFAFTTEMTLFDLGNPSVSLTADDPDSVLSSTDLNLEKEKIEDDLEGITAAVSVGISYRF